MIDKLIKIANLELKNVYYNKTLIDKFAATIKNYLLKKGYFVGKTSFQNFVNYKNNRVKIAFSVDLTHKKKLVFFGNHFFNNNDLLAELTVFGQSALLMPASMLVDQLETLYKKRGFWNIKVEWKEEEDSYYFVINEGPRAKIIDVELVGANWFDSDDLVNQCFGELIKSKFFDSEILKHSIDKLTTKYMQDGFWDFSL